MAAGLSGCQQPENENGEEPGKATVFELTQDTVTVAAEGGEASISYRLEEPKDGATVQPSYEADWLGDFDASVEGTITFTVAANETDAKREAEVVVAYADQQDSFVVVQNAVDGGDEPEPDPDAPFDITVNVSEGTAIISVVPKDKEMTYDCGAITPASLNMFPDDMTFVEEYLIPFYQQQAEAGGMTVEELLSQWLLVGDQPEIKVTGLAAETEYYAYCIGLTTSLEITSEFVKVPFETDPLKAFDATVEVTVTGPHADVKVTPADPEEGYLIVVFEGHGLDTDAMVAGAQQYVENMVMMYTIWGSSRESVVAMITSYGEKTNVYDLTALTEYTAAAVALSTDGNGTVSSAPAIDEFTTGETPQSDNVITFEMDHISGHRADYTVYTTNDDPYVFFTYPYTDEWKAMSEQEIIDYISANEDLAYWTRTGSVSTYDEGLWAETEYVVYAFGYSGGNVNTGLFTFTYTTTETTYNDSKFTYEFGPYYNGTEAAEKYPDQLANAVGKVVFPATYQVEGDWYGIWHDLYQGDMTDETEYSDEIIYMALRQDGNTWLSQSMVYILEFDQVYTLCGFVETEDGSFSELYRQTVGPFTLDGCSPIDQFEGNFAPASSNAAKALAPIDPMQTVSKGPEADTRIQTVTAGTGLQKEAGKAIKAEVSEGVRIYRPVK